MFPDFASAGDFGVFSVILFHHRFFFWIINDFYCVLWRLGGCSSSNVGCFSLRRGSIIIMACVFDERRSLVGSQKKRAMCLPKKEVLGFAVLGELPKRRTAGVGFFGVICLI